MLTTDQEREGDPVNFLKKLTRLLLPLTGLSALLAGGSAWAADYAASWGPEIGSTLPVLEAPDQTGTTRTLETLAGDNGLLLFLNRSADW